MDIDLITISTDTVRSFVSFLRLKGLNTEDLELERLKLDRDFNFRGDLASQSMDHVVDIDIYEALIRYADSKLQNTCLGFEFGQCMDAERWGILGYISYTAPTFQVVLEKQQKYQCLVGNFGLPINEYGDEFSWLKWLPAYQCSHHVVEAVLTGWVAMARKVSDSQIPLMRLYFQHECQGDLQDYLDYFQCDVRFNCEFNGLAVANSVFSFELNQHNPIVHESLINKADNIIEKHINASLLETITQYIQNQLPFGLPEIEQTAEYFCMSVRTLQRRLGEYSLTYRNLLDDARKKLAIRYLTNTNTELIYIAQLLGFAEQSSFQRAFKRWTDETPNAFRRGAEPVL